MKIAVVGTRGIPNNYGGFEQFAEYLALGLVKKGHEVTVYNSHMHPYQEKQWQGVDIKHIYDPEDKVGTAGQFVYDFLSILDTRKKNFDIILELGYTSSSVFFDFHPKNAIVVTNMDGLEWKRTKYSKKVQKFLQWAEKLAVNKSDHLVSDSMGIEHYLQEKYGVVSTYIPYGSHVFERPDQTQIVDYDVKAYEYNMLIARLEPENNIETILDGVVASKLKQPFLVIGKHETKYGEYLKNKFHSVENIHFVGGVYNIEVLNNLRYFSNVYFHGHTVGGTNPSLLEAMGSNALICAHQNEFNSAILGEDALYFKDATDVAKVLEFTSKEKLMSRVLANIEKIKELYNWDRIVTQYEALFLELLANHKGENTDEDNIVRINNDFSR